MFTKHRKKNYQRLLFFIVICYCFILASGCVHFHSKSNAKLANDTLTTFENGIKGSTNIFTSMKNNHEKTEKNVIKLNDSLASSTLQTFSTSIHSYGWDKPKAEVKSKPNKFIFNELGSRLAEISGKKDDGGEDSEIYRIDSKIKTLLKAKDTAKEKIADTKNVQKNSKLSLSNAIDYENKWFARHQLLLETIKFVSNTASSETEQFDEGTLKKLKTEILNTEIDTKALEGEEIKSEKKSLKDILEDDLKEVAEKELGIDRLLKKYTVDLFDPNAAPGLKVLLLSTAVDLAKAQLSKAKLEVWFIEEKLYLYKGWKSVLSDTKRLIESTQKGITLLLDGSDKIEKHFTRTEYVIDEINRLRSEYSELEKIIKENATEEDQIKLKLKLKLKLKDKASAINIAFASIVNFAIVKTIKNSKIEYMKQQPSVIDHEYSIRQSAIQADENAALIRSGLKGLVAYHEGGVKPETIANIIRSAEAVALTILAADID